MPEENKNIKEKEESKEKHEEKKVAEQPKGKKVEEDTKEEKKEEQKRTEIKEKKKEEKAEEKPKKTEAVAYGKDLPISTKHAVAICKFIRGKRIDKAVSLLGEVLKMKRAVPMKLEIPHRKGKGMERGRYPIKASQHFVKLLRQLASNATINELELEKGRIECKANRASRPYKKFGREKFKRTHVMLKLKEPKKKKPKQEKEGKK